MTGDRPGLVRRALAEGLAAFALVFAGCGAVIADAANHRVLGPVGVSLVFGLVIMAMVYATGHLSGAHLNPAVTVAFTLTRHFPLRDAAAYLAAQLAGASAGALLLLAAWPEKPARLGATVPSALVAGEWHHFWIYVAGPLIGAALGAFAYQFVRTPQAAPEGASV